MSRYIDANILKEKILEERDKIPLQKIDRYSFGVPTPYRDGAAMRGGIRKALRCLEQTPAADVVEVRHGKWYKHDKKKHGDTCYHCSVCENYALSDCMVWELTDYCPYCGAKMDGERREE